jgi:hypothetical protein
MRCVRATVICAHRRDIITQDHRTSPPWPDLPGLPCSRLACCCAQGDGGLLPSPAAPASATPAAAAAAAAAAHCPGASSTPAPHCMCCHVHCRACHMIDGLRHGSLPSACPSFCHSCSRLWVHQEGALSSVDHPCHRYRCAAHPQLQLCGQQQSQGRHHCCQPAPAEQPGCDARCCQGWAAGTLAQQAQARCLHMQHEFD